MSTKTIKQLCFILFLLLVLMAIVAHIIQDQRMADSNKRLREYVAELQARNVKLYQTADKLNEQVMWDEMYQAALYADFMDALSPEEPEQTKSSRSGERPELLGEYTVTGFCKCEKCCGKRDRSDGKVIGAAGIELTPGISVAAPLPFGTDLVIDGRRYVVQDRTADWIVDRYGGKIIDIYFDSHEAALEWGKQEKEVYEVSRKSAK